MTDITDGGGTVLFAHKELACPETGEVILAPGFADALRDLRKKYGHPMIVMSCCRTASYNEEIGGHPRSLHVYDQPHHPTGGTAAIDVQRPEGPRLHRLIELATAHGWAIGIASKFVHLDRRVDIEADPMTPVIYTY